MVKCYIKEINQLFKSAILKCDLGVSLRTTKTVIKKFVGNNIIKRVNRKKFRYWEGIK